MDGRTLQETAQERAESLPAVTLEHPFGPGWEVFKVRGKVFMLMTDVPGRPVVILKSDPIDAEALRATHADISPGYHMNKKHWIERLGGRLSRLLQKQSKLSDADYGVLVNLTDVPEGRRRYQDLARALEWEKSRMSHQIARMANRGLVVREECAEDARGAFVVITPAGRAAIEAAAPLHVAAVRELFLDHVTPAELRTLAQISERVVEKMDESPL